MRIAFTLVCSLMLVVLPWPVLWADDAAPGKQEGQQPIRLSKTVDLRPRLKRWRLEPRSQGSRNTCSVFVTTGALEFAASECFARRTALSVEYLNWACNQVIKNETEDRGQFFHDLLKGFEQYGICLEADMPYEKRFDPKLKPSEKATRQAKEIGELGLRVHWINPWKPQPGLTYDHLRQIKMVLAKGYPVAAGSSHSRLIVGYFDDPRQPGGGIFLTKDSGAAAYNTITYEFAQEKVGDVFWVEAPEKAAEKKARR